MEENKIYDIVVIGGGPAGCMAAIRAAQRKKRVLLIERNRAIGKKLLLTGNKRCNLTNSASLEVFIRKFGVPGRFLRSAFYDFSNQDLMGFFKARGLALKEEVAGKMFPVTGKASSVVKVLIQSLEQNRVDVMYNTRVRHLTVKERGFSVDCGDRGDIETAKLILATGGKSYPETGSSGDGLALANKLGHGIAPLLPGLVPLKIKEAFVSDLKGVSLENVRLIISPGRKKKIVCGPGEMLFTHFGISGPLVLDLSAQIVNLLQDTKEIFLCIDLSPELSLEKSNRNMVKDFENHGSKKIKNILKEIMPQKLTGAVLNLAKVDFSLPANQVTRQQRLALCQIIKSFPLTVTGFLPLEQAMVTSGGVSLKEVRARTMESRLIHGLYFAGEILEGAAPSGGFNLQQAFSTGFLAGESAAFELKA